MKTIRHAALGAILCAAALAGADTGTPSAGKIYDEQFKSLEGELVPLAEAMPADKYNFAPSNGSFTGVRTFALQAKHVAYIIYAVSAAMLEQKNPSQTVAENGPANLTSKAQIVARVSMASTAIWHSYDHYGQMVVYTRMNGVIPPASRH